MRRRAGKGLRGAEGEGRREWGSIFTIEDWSGGRREGGGEMARDGETK